MQINRINTAMAFKGGYDPYEAALTPKITLQHFDDFGVPVTFRDDELFDPTRDTVDKNYKIYDYDDVQLYKPARDSQLKKCREFFGITDRPRVEFITEPILGYRVVGARDEDDELNTRIPILNESSQPFVNACYLRTKGGKPEFSYPLFMKLKEYKAKTDCQYIELVSIARNAKLKNRNKTEYVNPLMVDAAIYCMENFPYRSSAIMNAMITHDENGNQLFCNDAFKFLVESKIFSEHKAINMIDSLMYEDENGVVKFNTELSNEILKFRKKDYSIERIEDILSTANAIVSGDSTRIDSGLIDKVSKCQDMFYSNSRSVLMVMQTRDESGKTTLLNDAYDFVVEAGLQSGFVAERILRKAMVKGENGTKTFDRDIAEKLLSEYKAK